jgi:hypothetical protein
MSLAPREGAQVTFVGDEFSGERLSVGDQGKVLSNGGSGSHVIWATGERQGAITLTSHSDLLPAEEAGAYCHHEGHLVSLSVRQIYDRRGDTGLFKVLAEEGHLASVAPSAEEALGIVIARLRDDPAVQEVLASLDEDEGDSFVSYAALALLRDAFGE